MSCRFPAVLTPLIDRLLLPLFLIYLPNLDTRLQAQWEVYDEHQI